MNPSRPLRAFLFLALTTPALAAHAQNLVQDGGFESAIVGINTGTPYGLGESFDGFWRIGNPPSGAFGSFFITKQDSYASSGVKAALFYGASVVQTLATRPGQAYLLTFDAKGASDGAFPITVGFGGSTSVVSAAGFNQVPHEYPHFSLLFNATSASTDLSIGESTFGNAPYVFLDNVSVTAVPEPSAFLALGIPALALLRRRRS